MILIHPSLLNALINTILIHLGPGAREVLGKPITCIFSRDKMWWKNNRLEMSVHVFVYEPRLSSSMSTHAGTYWEQFVQLNKLTQWGWRHSSVSWLTERSVTDRHGRLSPGDSSNIQEAEGGHAQIQRLCSVSTEPLCGGVSRWVVVLPPHSYHRFPLSQCPVRWEGSVMETVLCVYAETRPAVNSAHVTSFGFYPQQTLRVLVLPVTQDNGTLTRRRSQWRPKVDLKFTCSRPSHTIELLSFLVVFHRCCPSVVHICTQLVSLYSTPVSVWITLWISNWGTEVGTCQWHII